MAGRSVKFAHFNINEALKERFRAQCEKEGYNMSAKVKQLIEKYLWEIEHVESDQQAILRQIQQGK